MPIAVIFAITAVIAYLLGSVPFGLFFVRLFAQKDVREVGSGRTGGTNAYRAGGMGVGILTAIADIMKGFAAVYIGRLLLGDVNPFLDALAGTAAVAGHNWPIFLRFKGGAGTTPNAGAAMALWSPMLIVLLPVVSLVVWLTGYASVASTVAALVVVIVFIARWLLVASPAAYIGYGIATTILVALALLPNYNRLIEGTERLVGPRARLAAQESRENSG
jgi:glycerol-3-phosphate acyltransferase PlsY